MTDPIATGELVHRLERAERQRDKLAEALRDIGDMYCIAEMKGTSLAERLADRARAALAELEKP